MTFFRSASPYYDDYDPQKNFAQILFRPGVAVQTRELNQLQTILQNQIQRFGDHVLKRGTIVSGGQINLHPNLPYVKILDNDTSANPVNVTDYLGYYVRNSLGVKALVVTGIAGQVAQTPDLNTLYVKYINGGTATTNLTFAANDTLTVYDPTDDSTVAIVTVAGSGESPIGKGYGISIEEGVVYHAGYFTRTDKQLVIVSKYDNEPDGVCVGFDTTFEVVTSDDDVSLLDNTTGTPNATAPGADRLKATAFVYVLDKDVAAETPEFLSIIEFSEGQPFKLEPQTQYNTLDQHLARRTYEESGDYVVDPFLVTTKSTSLVDEDATFNVVVDPGVAYVRGYRVASESNFVVNLPKATTTKTTTGMATAVDYGSYVNISNYRGNFDSLIGQLIDLRSGTDTGVVGSNITANGSVIGNARVKAFVPTVRAGSNEAKIYLYDVKMAAGYAFNAVRSIQTSGLTFTANVQLQTDSTSANVAVLLESNRSTSIFNSVPALKSATNVTFTYAKSNWGTLNVSTAGSLTLTVSSPDIFETAGAMTRSQLDQILISPSFSSVTSTVALTGTVTTTNTSTSVTGSGTSFTTELVAGQSIIVGSQVVQVKRIISNTSLEAVTAATATVSGGAAYYYYPRYAPISIISGTVAGDRLSATLTVTQALPASMAVTAIAPVRTTQSLSSKSVTRNAAVRLNLSNNVAGTSGPWCLGIPDAIHLRGVYKGANTTFTTASGGITNVTNDFYIDSNHQTDSLGLGYLFKKSKSTLTLSSSDRLLVLLDVLTMGGSSVRTISSYPIDDDVTLASSAATINTLELPEVFGSADQYYDVRDCYDFRTPYANTVSIGTTQSTAPINPAEATYASQYAYTGAAVPMPGSVINADVEQYQGRLDRIIVNPEGVFSVIQGEPGTGVPPIAPQDALTINILRVPPYPSVPMALSASYAELADTKITNEKDSRRRIANYTITTTLTQADIARSQPKGYTMKEIGAIDRRLSNVEYYVALNQAEARTVARSIPSSNNPSTDRFKFGFFTDSFIDQEYSDLINPQYRASIADGVIKPRSINATINFMPLTESGSGGITTLAYSDHVLIEQLGATNGPVVPANGDNTGGGTVITPDSGTGGIIIAPPPETDPDVITPPPVVVPPAPIITQSIVSVDVRSTNSATSQTGLVYETFDVKMSSTDGPVEIYFDGRDLKFGIDIYQGTTPGFNWVGTTPVQTIVSAVDLTSLDKTTKAAGLATHYEALDSVSTYSGYSAREDSGKMLFTHNAAGGQYYTIVFRKFKHSGGLFGGQNGRNYWIYRLYYPTDSVTTFASGGIPITFDYFGTVTNAHLLYADLNAVQTPLGNYQFYIPDQPFTIEVTGLKPNTKHFFSFEGVDQSANVFMAGSSTAGITTDSSGRATFTYYYSSGGTSSTEYTLQNITMTSTPSKKKFVIYAADYSSLAGSAITTPSYYASLVARGMATGYMTGEYTGGGGIGGGGGAFRNENVDLV